MENIPKKDILKRQSHEDKRWKGGVADYPNHYQMKLNRLEKLEQTKGKCEICNKEANQIHHRDGSRDNHAISNLIVLCRKHHVMVDITNTQHKTSKYLRKYGMTLREMTEKLGEYSVPALHYLLKNPSIKRDVILKRLGIAERPSNI